MVAGQVLDTFGEQQRLSEQQLITIHTHKTGDMICAACQLGVIAGGGSQRQLEKAGEFAYRLGLAFQIRDDILDEISTPEELGKPIGSDADNKKFTYVSLLGIDECQKRVENLTDQAISALEYGGFQDIEFLKELAFAMVERRN